MAPGPDGIPNRFLALMAAPFAEVFTRLFQACLDAGYHPRRFKEAKTVILRKPAKPDYSEVKAYRPIALLCTLGKALEMMVSKVLSDCAEANNLLPEQQMGARRGRSTETALEGLVDSIATTWSHGKKYVASLLSLDVAGAFDKVNHQRLLHNLRAKRVPRFIVNWTKSFLEDRATSISLGQKTSQMEPAMTGIPQGSPISPVLFLFFNGPLIEELAKLRQKVQVGGFVDDVHLLAYGTSTAANCLELRQAHEVCLRWARTHGAQFAPQKYELVHMTRYPKRHDMTATVDLGQVAVKPEASIRVLGLQIDNKLNWKAHMAKVKRKMASQERGLTCLTASTWGATLQEARTVYQAVVKPAMTYAAAIWHAPQGTPGAKKSAVQQLQLVQNRCLRAVTGAYKATPTAVLESEAYMPPIDLALDQIVLQSRLIRGTHPATKMGNERIRRNLKRSKTTRTASQLTPPPSETKLSWAKVEWAKLDPSKLGSSRTQLDRAGINGATMPNLEIPADTGVATLEKRSRERAIHQRTLEAWAKRWQQYRATVPDRRRYPALREDTVSDVHLKRHGKMRKGDSALAVQLRTGKKGLAHFLFTVHAGNLTDASCSCGWRKQDAAHILTACPLYADLRLELVKKAGTSDHREILSTGKGIRAAARFMMFTGLLPQFGLAKEMEEVVEGEKEGARRGPRGPHRQMDTRVMPTTNPWDRTTDEYRRFMEGAMEPEGANVRR